MTDEVRIAYDGPVTISSGVGGYGRDEWGEPGTVAIRRTQVGELRTHWVESPWPKFVLVAPDLINNGDATILGVSGSFLTFVVANGRARYEKVGQEGDYWKCRLVDSAFEPPPASLT